MSWRHPTLAIYYDLLRAAFRKYRPTVGKNSKFDFAHCWLIDNSWRVMKHAVVSFPNYRVLLLKFKKTHFARSELKIHFR